MNAPSVPPADDASADPTGGTDDAVVGLWDRLPPAATAFLVVFLLLVPVYAVTATWRAPYGIDAWTNAVTGWHIANEGTPVAAGYQPVVDVGERGFVAWFVPGRRGPVSQYPPGAALTVAPFYALSGVEAPAAVLAETRLPDVPPVTVPAPPVWPATVSAVLVTAAAVALLASVTTNLGLALRPSVLVGVVAGLTTSAWSVASGRSWAHGPAMLAIALASLFASRDRWLACGLALGAGILVRPHIAVIAAAVGVLTSLSRRRWRPLLLVGAGAGAGLVALLAINAALFGEPSITGGYDPAFAESALSTTNWGWFAQNVGRGLLSPRYGLLTWAPFLLVLGLTAVRMRRSLPDWTIAATVGGIVYLLLQWKANRASGGGDFFPYRYPLTTLAAAGPLLALAAVETFRSADRLLVRMLVVGLAIAGAGQLLGAVSF